ncbi:MAG: MSHA biogenesis protein MshK [Ectothiorhodospiraceae bacterium]|nr:MSHA biogenesis protein MshK [Chromatiales bacterium]MCP5155030.1 MSHA biogenesis protein MshK [Ectothiorhodospiraceae bacterium]
MLARILYIVLVVLAAASPLVPPDAARANGLDDPTRPVVPAPAPAPTAVAEPTVAWQLTMVRVSRGDRIAVIDGTVVREGDRIGDAVVTRIDSVSVTLEHGGNRELLTLIDPAVRRMAQVDPEPTAHRRSPR